MRGTRTVLYMDKDRWAEYQHLRDSGLQLEKDNSIKFNAGGSSETPQHIVAKALAGKVCLEAGYRVNSEVEVPNGEIDLVAFSHPKRLSYAVECENDLTPETKKQKLQHYVYETGLDDMAILELENMPNNITEALH